MLLLTITKIRLLLVSLHSKARRQRAVLAMWASERKRWFLTELHHYFYKAEKCAHWN